MKLSIYIKRIVFTILILQCSWGVFAQEGMIKEAEAAYTQENYTEAIRLYEEILKVNGASVEIYYNLGNAYYKADRIAPAILNYERALILAPGDADVRFNLQLAKQRTVDNIEPVDDFFLVKWFKAVQNTISVDSWAIFAIVCFLLLILSLLLFFFSRWVSMKKAGFYLGLISLVLVIVANIFAKNQKDEILNRKKGIVFSPTVTIKSSPDASGTDLFILHEGTKVSIKSTLGEWNEIESEDGNVGWITKKDMEII